MIKRGQPLRAEKAAWGGDSGDLNLRIDPAHTWALGHTASCPVKQRIGAEEV